MTERIIKQSIMLLLVVMALFIAKNSHVKVLEMGADKVLAYMNINYSANDIKSTFAKGKEMAVSVTSKMNETVSVIVGKPLYGEPIDEKFSGNETSVYAVGGGEVTSVGENEEIGKYIKITHGASGESLYGNLGTVNVTVPCRVKKGDIIASYKKSEDKEFYYSFREFP